MNCTCSFVLSIARPVSLRKKIIRLHISGRLYNGHWPTCPQSFKIIFYHFFCYSNRICQPVLQTVKLTSISHLFLVLICWFFLTKIQFFYLLSRFYTHTKLYLLHYFLFNCFIKYYFCVLSVSK